MNRISGLASAVLASASLVLAAVGPAPAAEARPDHRSYEPVTHVDNGAATAGTRAVAVGDLDHDRIPDIVSAPTGLGLSVSLGLRHHRFSAAKLYALPADLEVNSLILAIVIADVTGDGRPDVIGTGANNNIVITWRGHGDGTFDRGSKFDLNSDPLCDRQSGDPCAVSFPIQLVVDDFDHDRRPDIVTINTNTDNVAVLFGREHGGFDEPVLYPLGFRANPQSIAVRDLNRDRSPDLVVANSGAGTLAVLLGDRHGTFAKPVTYPTGIDFPADLVLADVTGDGIADAVTSDNGYDGHVSVVPGRRRGLFGAPRVLAAGTNPTGLVVADFDRDRRPDLAVTESGTDTIDLFRGGPCGLRTRPTTITLDGASGPAALTAARLDRDGYPDLVVASQFSPGKDITVVWNPGQRRR